MDIDGCMPETAICGTRGRIEDALDALKINISQIERAADRNAAIITGSEKQGDRTIEKAETIAEEIEKLAARVSIASDVIIKSNDILRQQLGKLRLA